MPSADPGSHAREVSLSILDPSPAWWGFRRPPRRRHSILELIAGGTLDAELAAVLWLLVERTVSVLVGAAPPLAGKTTLLSAVLDFAPASAELRLVTGDRFDEAAGDPTRDPAEPRQPFYVLAPELSDHLPVYIWGREARRLVQLAGRGVGVAATIHARRLEDVFEQLAAPPVSLTADELSHLGVVLMLGVVRVAGSWQRRVLAAHYVRPLARDAGGHVQRRPPAVLATWDPADDSFSHFEWGIADELAGRVGLATAEFEAERGRRSAYLQEAVESGRVDLDAALQAIRAYGSSGRASPGGRRAGQDVV